MNRTDLQRIAERRVAEAKTLLDSAHYEGAYYLLGYAVECALKACFAKRIKEHDFPDKKLINDSYTHDLEKLLNIAGLRTDYEQKIATDAAFADNWLIVRNWSEEARYQVQVAEETARGLHAAVMDANSGVLPWLKNLW